MEENSIGMRYNPNSTVSMANSIIRGQQDDFTLLEAKLIRLTVAQVAMDSTDFQTYSCRVSDLARFLEIDVDNIYREVEGLTDNLMKKVIKIVDKSKQPKKNGEYNWKKFHWVDTCSYDNGIIQIKLSSELKPYLLELNQLFTLYGLDAILKLPTTNSIRLYELLASYRDLVNTYKPGYTPTNIFPHVQKEDNELIFSIDYLKEYFGCQEKYKSNNGDFIRWVIKSSVKAINNKAPDSAMKVSYRVVREGRFTKYVLFKINEWGDSDFRQMVMDGK